MKLGDRVQYKKCLIASKWFCGDIDKEATKEFAITNGMRYAEGDFYYDGWTVLSKWKVKTYPEVQTGIICGVRTIDISGQYDYDEGWTSGKKKKVYLVARNMTGFDRVPEEFIITQPG